MNRHFVEMLRALSAAGAEFLIIGGHAVAAYGYARATKDVDIWIRPTLENARRVWSALTAFGAPLEELSIDDLITPGTVFQIGVDPGRIDLLTEPAGLGFDEAWARRVYFSVEHDSFPFLSKTDLITTKRASGRPHDLHDIEELERLK